MTKKLKTIAAIAFAVAALAVKLLWPEVNLYEIAQQQTVLVRTSDGTGSGVVVRREDATGVEHFFVWTAAHVVEGEAQVSVERIYHSRGERVGGEHFDAHVLLADHANDVALLWFRAPEGHFKNVDFGQSLEVGTPVYHVGNFLADFDTSVSTGIISQTGVQPAILGWPWPVTDQTDLTSVPGSSGGGVFANGKLIGLIVGGVGRGALGFGNYVPSRVIFETAEANKVSWAVDAETPCPGSAGLRVLAALYASKLPPKVEDILLIIH